MGWSWSGIGPPHGVLGIRFLGRVTRREVPAPCWGEDAKIAKIVNANNMGAGHLSLLFTYALIRHHPDKRKTDKIQPFVIWTFDRTNFIRMVILRQKGARNWVVPFFFGPGQCLGSISTPRRSKNMILGGICKEFRGASF